MSKRRFEMYQYRQALVRMRQGDSDRDIARDGLMGRKKLKQVRAAAAERGWLETAAPVPDDATLAAVFAAAPRASTCVSTLAPLRGTIAAWFQAGLQGTTIHAALQRNHGYAGSYSAVRRLLQGLASEAMPEATSRLDFNPGEAAQVDFGRGPDFVDVHTGEVIKSGFFVMTLAWSRHQYAEFVLDQTVETWLACHRRAFEWFGGVPARIIIDNPKCAITRACNTDPTVQRAYAECAEGFGFKISPCPPRDPQKKGHRRVRGQVHQARLRAAARVPQPGRCQPATARVDPRPGRQSQPRHHARAAAGAVCGREGAADPLADPAARGRELGPGQRAS
jgi:hypothetical protein